MNKLVLPRFTRREFIKLGAAGVASAYVPISTSQAVLRRPSYTGPNVILVRFGGGVRRQETIQPESTYAPYFLRKLAPQGTLFTNMEIAQLDNIETSHGQGTLYLLTGKYDSFKKVGDNSFSGNFEAQVPTLFEYVRKVYDIPEHQTLIINGEDRTDEEFYTFSNHHLFGVNFRSNVLSLYWYKVYLLEQQIREGVFSGSMLEEKTKELAKLRSLDFRTGEKPKPAMEVDRFWSDWRSYFGETGLVNPRGDALLTELALQAMRKLHPKLVMINYNDPDYVHWGNPSHYTRGIAVIDQGLERLQREISVNEFYRDNTVMVIVPDCGRDDNSFVSVPFQHHFNSRSSHEIFALFIGPKVPRGVVIRDKVEQVSVAPTIGRLMGVQTEFAEGDVLEAVFG